MSILKPHVIQKDGSLHDLGWYLAWSIGADTACLDGSFTAAELRAIAEHMERHGNRGEERTR